MNQFRQRCPALAGQVHDESLNQAFLVALVKLAVGHAWGGETKAEHFTVTQSSNLPEISDLPLIIAALQQKPGIRLHSPYN